MKKIVIVVFALLMLLNISFAQEMRKGTTIASIGVGPAFNYTGVGLTGLSPAFRFTYEKGIVDIKPGTLSIGAELGISHQVYKTSYYEWTIFGYRSMAVARHYIYPVGAVRAAWHYNFGNIDPDLKGLNAYAGGALGLRYELVADTYSDATVSTYNKPNNRVLPHISSFLGASYYFKPNMAVFVEAGYDISYTTFGLIFRL